MLYSRLTEKNRESMRNLIEQAFDKLVTTKSIDQRFIEYSKKYPNTAVSHKGITYKNGKTKWEI